MKVHGEKNLAVYPYLLAATAQVSQNVCVQKFWTGIGEVAISSSVLRNLPNNEPRHNVSSKIFFYAALETQLL